MANTLTFASQTITDAHIFGGINYLVDLNAGEEFSIGNTASASVSFVTDIQLPLYSKSFTNGTFTWSKDGVSRGRYYITEVTKEADKYTVRAYDAMTLLDKPITTLSITYPVTASALATQIATYMGCTISGTIINGGLSVSELDPLFTIRAVLGHIAAASGCSVKVDGADHLCFMYYEDSEVTKTASEYVSLNVADYTCAVIDNVTIFNSEGEIQATAGSGINSLFIGQNPFLNSATSAHATAIYNVVKDFAYAPLKCELFNDDDIEVGTIVTFGTTPTLVMHVESSEGGAVASSVGSDIRANYNKSALEVVGEAKAIAVDAQTVAGIANGILAGMQTAATAAGTTLNGIYATAEEAYELATTVEGLAREAKEDAESADESAREAKADALSASQSANSALAGLSIIEDVVGMLEWLAEHRTLSTDTTVVDGKIYYTYNEETGAISRVNPVGTENPSEEGWYEMSDAMADYVSTHLSLTSSGLWIIKDGTSASLQLNENGMSVYPAGSNVPIATYGADATIGDANGFHITITANYQNSGEGRVSFYRDSTNEVAYVSGDSLYINKSVVVQQMNVGLPQGVVDTSTGEIGHGQWSWKVHQNVDGENNLYLKWLG